MRTFHVIGALALILSAGSVRAQSSIPGNNIDDFGPYHYSNPAPTPDQPVIAARASLIPGNQIDDFGPLVPESFVTEEELGAAGAEPGMEVKVDERAQEKAALKAYAQERFLRETWTNP
jgi:hypothetical protein